MLCGRILPSINMQHSRSLGSFSSDSTTAPILRKRPQSRSSMDTFVIKGRTRIPSNQPQAADLQIAEALLDSNPTIARRSLSMNMAPKEHNKNFDPRALLDYIGYEDTDSAGSSTETPVPNRRQEKRKSDSAKNEAQAVDKLETNAGDSSLGTRTPVQTGSRTAPIVIPNRRRSRRVGDNPPPKRAVLTPKSRKDGHARKQQPFYDGAIGSSYESRTTSMTWSTVSHRIFSESSNDAFGMGASENLDEFNRLAVQHGLPELEECPCDESKESKELVEKAHQPNWLSRKFFHRSTSSYHLKVKSTHKTLKHRKSFVLIPKLDIPGEKNIFLDKSLEEICRLGGTGSLVLPDGFGARKRYSLPTSLSATATYLLQHGTNYPGLFRISGQSTSVNALYEFYAFQFIQAGSPSKVQETVGSSLLPMHVEHSTPDVASGFKKIVNALPGGLLGSLELFEALRNIFFHIVPAPGSSGPEKISLQARLIALAILSVRSARRATLIQAVIGMVAYFAHEAEDAMKAAATNGENDAQVPQHSSELMGFRELGVVIGPLMLGALADQVQLSPQTPFDIAPRRSIDSGKKGDKKTEKKQKRNSGNDKLGRDAELSAHVDRANIMAAVLERLLAIWKDVVIQLRDENASLSSQNHSKPPLEKRDWAGHREESSEEGVLFMDMLKAGPPGVNFSGTFKMKQKTKVGKSPMSRNFRKVSLDPFESKSALDSSRELPGSIVHTPGTAAICGPEISHPTKDPGSSSTEGTTERDIEMDKRTKSDIAMDQMSMGTILLPPPESSVAPFHQNAVRSGSHQRPRTPQIEHLSQGTPETALRDIPRQETDAESISKRSDSLFEKPLPPIGAAQRAELSPRKKSSGGRIAESLSNRFPARGSSLPPDKGKQRESSSGSSQARQPVGGSSPTIRARSRRSSMTPTRRQLGQYEIEQATDGNSVSKSSSRSKRGSNRAPAEIIDTTPSTTLELESSVPKIFARIYTQPDTNHRAADDSFTPFPETPSENGSPKKTRIPKPAQELGHTRKDSSPSSSPPKSPRQSPAPARKLVRKRTSIFSIIPDLDTDTARRRSVSGTVFHSVAEDQPTTASSEIPVQESFQVIDFANHETPLKETTVPETQYSPPPPPANTTSNNHEKIGSVIGLEVAPMRPLSAYSAESLRRMRHQEEPPVAQHVPSRMFSFDVNGSEDTKIAIPVTKTGFENLERTGSINSAMSAEIIRLKRLLEQKEKEVRETRRSLELSRDLNDDDTNVDGSPRKGTLANELRLSRKEAAEWKKRAEWAESRLLVVSGEMLEGKGDLSKGSSRAATPRNGGSVVVERPKNWFPE